MVTIENYIFSFTKYKELSTHGGRYLFLHISDKQILKKGYKTIAIFMENEKDYDRLRHSTRVTVKGDLVAYGFDHLNLFKARITEFTVRRNWPTLSWYITDLGRKLRP